VRDAAVKGTISDFPKEEYFCVHDWTADSPLNCLMNFDFSRERFLQDFACLARHDPATYAHQCPSGKSPPE
jgi:hypothetical protein